MRKNKYFTNFKITGYLSQELPCTYTLCTEIVCENQTGEEIYTQLKIKAKGAILREEKKHVLTTDIVFTTIALLDSEPIEKQNENT